MSASMFTVIPLPASCWDDNGAPLVIPFFPFVGAVIGGLWYALAYVLTSLTGAHIKASFLTAAAVTLCPLFLSGFIHTDGFLDTADAVFSRRGRDEKLRILKDPNVGAFAAASLGVLLLVSFCAVFDGMPYLCGPPPVLIFLPVISRCAGGMFLLAAKPLSETGYAALFKRGTGARHMLPLVAAAAACFILICMLRGAAGVVVLAAAACSGAAASVFLYGQFGGVSGDVCGAVVTVAELAGLVAYAMI